MNRRDSTRQKSSFDRKGPSRAVSISVAAWCRRQTAICSSRSATTSDRKSLRKNSTTTLARLSASRPTARRPPTIHSSARTERCRKSGPTVCATRKVSPSIRPTENCGSRSTGPWAVTKSISSRKAKLRLAARECWRQLRRHTSGHRQVRDGGRHKPDLALDAFDRSVWYGFLHGRPYPRLEGQLAEWCAEVRAAVAARVGGRQGRERGASSAEAARAHSRRATGAGWCRLSAHRQRIRTHPACRSGEMIRRNCHHVLKTKNAPAAINAKPKPWLRVIGCCKYK